MNRLLTPLAAFGMVFSAFATPQALADGPPPTLMYSTVLNGLQLDHNSGWFRLVDVRALFLPMPVSTQSYQYNPDEGGKLTAVLSSADGQRLAEYRFYAQHVKTVFWHLTGYQTELAAGLESHGKDVKLTTAGAYQLEFAVEGTPFYRVPFEVEVAQSGDPYNPGQRYFLNGAWKDMGYIYFAEARKTNGIAFKMWLRNKDAQGSDEVSLEVLRGDKVVAVSGSNFNTSTYSLKPEWVRYEFSFVQPPKGKSTQSGSMMNAGQVLSKDGAYSIRVKVNGQDYTKYAFDVEGGDIKHQGRQVREGTDPLRFVEGGRDAWWLQAL